MKVNELRELLSECDGDEEVVVAINLDEMAVNVPIVASDILSPVNTVSLFINMYGMTIAEFERVTEEKNGT